ncbi:Cytochrome P450 4C1 [Blattella germanica]|nr:Cytochrome P450 4C1 [Blattella germanica]
MAVDALLRLPWSSQRGIEIINPWWILLVVLVLVIYSLRSWIRTAILVSRLPGPPALPIVGNVLQFYKTKALTEFSLKLHKQNVPLARIWATVIPVIVIFSPDFIQVALSGKEQLEKSFVYSLLKPTLGTSILTGSGRKLIKIINFISETAMGTPVNAQECNLFKDFCLTALRAYDIQIHRLMKPWLLLNSFFKFTEGSKVVTEHYLQLKELTERETPPVFLDFLLKLQEEGHGLTDKELMHEVKTLIVAAKVHEELNDIFGQSDRDATLEDLKRMKYLKRCLMETLRLFPAVPVIGKYKIPAGCELMIPIMFVHRQKEHYPYPYEFNPDNFLYENIQQRHSFAYLPFSAGPRNCIGQRFAWLELKEMVSTVLRSYSVESVSKKPIQNLTWKGILKTRFPMLIKLHPHKHSWSNTGAQ